MSRPRAIRLTPKERLAQSREHWVPPDTSIQIRGRTISDGMVYVGHEIGALSVNEPVEPAAIDPAHKGAKRSRRNTYYGWSYAHPSFARLTQEEQDAYLDWLAAGKRAVCIGVFQLDSSPLDASDATALEQSLAIAALLTSIAAEDGRLSEQAQLAISTLLQNALPADSALRSRYELMLEWQLRHPASYQDAKRALERAPNLDTAQIQPAMISTLATAGPPSAARIKELTKIYRLLGLPSEQVHADIHRSSTYRGLSDDPAAELAKRISTNLHETRLDTDRVAAVRDETEVIATILHDVFGSEEQPNEPGTSLVAGTPASDPYRRFLTLIAAQPAWTMAELTQLATSVGLMASGAIETLNDRAISLDLPLLLDCDGEVCDCYEPTRKELLAHG